MKLLSTSNFSKSLLNIILICSFLHVLELSAQANSIRTGATFNWADTQTNNSDPATLESIEINGNIYNTFVVPSGYSLIQVGPAGHGANNILMNGSNVLNNSSNPSWDTEALNAYQSLNLNYYFQNSGNGQNICGNYNALATTTAQIKAVTYSPAIPVNNGSVIAVTERNANNCQHIAIYGIPVGGGPEQMLGQTFVRDWSVQFGPKADIPPTDGTDYWLTGRVNENNGTIGIALYNLTDLAPEGSQLTEIRFTAATVDVADGKFFIMQEYAQDDSFNPDFEEVFVGDVGANDNVPSGSTYTASTSPNNGTLVLNNDGTFTYTPDPGYTGSDTFEVEVCLPAPNTGVCDTSTVTLNVKSAVSISNASATEGNNLTFTITTNAPINQDIGFNISYTDNSTSPADYSSPASVILPANATFVSFNVMATDDTWVENTESFNVIISDASNSVTIVDEEGLGEIFDNDLNASTGITVSDFTVDEAAGTATFIVSLNGNIQGGFAVDYTITDNSALAPSDYTANTMGTLNFVGTDGETQEITVTILNDSEIETDEQLSVSLSNLSTNLLSIVDGDGIGTITDNDSGGVSFTTSNVIVDEDAGTATFEIEFNGFVLFGFSLNYATTNNSAIEPDDYTNTNGILTFSGLPGEVKTITVPIIEDDLIEPQENYFVDLFNANAVLPVPITIITPRATGRINDNDGSSGTGISVDDFTVDEAAGTATFDVSLNANVQGGFSVNYLVTNESATSPDDYMVASPTGVLNFSGTNGETQSITVNIIDDTILEGNENLNISLSNLSTGLINIVDANAIGTITDNDGGIGTGISVTDFTIDESGGTANFAISTNVAVEGAYTVEYTIANGSAVRNQDFTVPSMIGTLNFSGAAGQIANVPIAITDDAVIEGSEDLTITINSISNPLINILDGNAIGIITDNDGGVGTGVSVAGFTVDEAVGIANFAVSTNVAVASAYTVDYTISNGSAIRNLDYTVPSMTGTVNFLGAAGQIVNVPINVTDDILLESTEDLTITLNSISNPLVNIRNGSAVGEILDNDDSGITIDLSANTTTEGSDIVFTATMSTTNNTGSDITMDIDDLLTGTATSGNDYNAIPANATITIADGSNSGTLNVNTLVDGSFEGDETVIARISNVTGAPLGVSIGTSDATGTIDDADDSGIIIDLSANTTTEGSDIVFTATMSATNNTGSDITIDIDDLLTGTATSGNDYNAIPANATITIADGSNSGTLNVTTLVDGSFEGDETVIARISNVTAAPAGVSIGASDATGTIDDADDSGITIDLSANTATEGSDIVFTATISTTNNTGSDITIDIDDLLTGTATSGNDYSAIPANANITIADGSNSGTLNVTTLVDGSFEGDETVIARISNVTAAPAGVSIGTSDATGTIDDADDSGITIDLSANTATEGSDIVFTATMSTTNNTGSDITIDIDDLLTGTATSGNDYNAIPANATITIADGSNSGTLDVTTLVDGSFEGDETVIARISNVMGAPAGVSIGTSDATGTITDNCTTNSGQLDVTGFSQTEGNTANFVIDYTGDTLGSDLVVNYTITDGSAIAGADYDDVTPVTGQVTIAAGASSANVTVDLLNDMLVEADETLEIALTAASLDCVTINTASATGTITDNCTTNNGQLDVTGFSQTEGNTANFAIDYTGDTLGSDLVVNYTITDGSAIAGADYDDVTPVTGQVTIAAGANSANVTVDLLNDMLVEADETLEIALTAASLDCVTINNANAIGTITDNCTTNNGQLDVTGFSQTEGNTANFVIDYTGDTLGSDLVVNYTITDGSAIAWADYDDVTPVTGQVTIAASASSGNVTVDLLNDMLVEAEETLEIALTAASLDCVAINTNSATGTILDDDGNDANEGIGVADFTVNEDAGTASFIISYTGNTVQNAFNVNFVVTEDSAISPEDYTVANADTFVTFPIDTEDGDIQVVTINIVDDVIVEAAESLNIALTFDPIPSSGVNMLDANGIGTITDNDSEGDFPGDVVVNCDAIPPIPSITLNAAGCDYTEVFEETISGQDDGCDTEYVITRKWTITDCVGNIREHVQVIAVEDNEAPTFVEALPVEMTVSCDAIPVAEVLTAIDNCDTNASVTLDEVITDNDSCPSDYTITRTWTAEDCAGNQTVHVQTITVEDNEAPTFMEALPENMIAICNEIPVAATLTATDNCDPDISVTFNEVITNDANCMDGYTVTRVWTALDCAGNENSHTQVITVEPNGPIMTVPYEEEITIMCGDELPEIPQLEFTGGCGNYNVEFTEDTTSLDTTDDYMIVRTWDVTDSCGNMAIFTQTTFVMQYQLEEITIEICVENDPINLLDYLPEPFDPNGTFEITQGNVIMEGSTFNPANLEVGEYRIAYSAENGPCQFFAEYSIVVNSDCVPCNRNEIKINDAITVNGDNINKFLEITGVEYCTFQFDIMVFNRWGDKVFEQANYQNDWGGSAPGGSFGNSGVLPSGTYYYVVNIRDVDSGNNLEPINGYIYLGTK